MVLPRARLVMVLLAGCGLPALPAPAHDRLAAGQLTWSAKAAHGPVRGRLTEAVRTTAPAAAENRGAVDGLTPPAPTPPLIFARWPLRILASARPGVRHPGSANPARAPPELL